MPLMIDAGYIKIGKIEDDYLDASRSFAHNLGYIPRNGKTRQGSNLT